FAKYSDAQINALIAHGGGQATLRLRGGFSDYKLFVTSPPDYEFNDTKGAWGLSHHIVGMGPQSVYSTCHSKFFAECDDLWTPAQGSFLDSLDWVRVHDNANINAK